MTPRSFQEAAGLAAILAGVGGFLYSISFVVISRAAPGLGMALSGLFLLLGGLLTSAVTIALYERFRPLAGAYALWAAAVGVAGALGSAIHGGYDLATALHPASQSPDLPNQVDPRGLATFGLSGLSLIVFGVLIGAAREFPAPLGVLAIVSAALLLVLYLARLVILSPTNPLVLLPAAVEGFVVNPAFYVWLGLRLRAAPLRSAATAS